LTTHDPSTDHDVGAGLRENFNARKRWRSAINSARALHRFGRRSRASSVSSSGSGGWGEDHTRSDGDGGDGDTPSSDGSPSDISQSFTKLSLGSSDPGTNDNVKVIGPEENHAGEQGKTEGSSAGDSLIGTSESSIDGETSPSDDEAPRNVGLQSEAERSGTITGRHSSIAPGIVEDAARRHVTAHDDEPELRMPGSLTLSDVHWGHNLWHRDQRAGRQNNWLDDLRNRVFG
jgi:calcium/calmodulin-dependent protein kinase I